MENIREYDEFVNEFRTYNISLSESDYTDLLRHGIILVTTGDPGQDSIKITYEFGVDNRSTVNLSSDEFNDISIGKVVNKGTIKLALQDIGLDRIMKLRKKYKK